MRKSVYKEAVWRIVFVVSLVLVSYALWDLWNDS